MENDATPVNQRQYLTFFLADEEYAVDILSVKEIIEYGNVTRVPAHAAVRARRDQPARQRRAGGRSGGEVRARAQPLTRRTCIVIVERRSSASAWCWASWPTP